MFSMSNNTPIKTTLIIFLLLLAQLGHTQNEKRLALVVGNAEYLGKGNTLSNPANDATDVSTKLKELGFDVTTLIDGDHLQLDESIEAFATKAKEYDVSIFYYSGHGLQSKGNNYLVPVDAELKSEADVKYKCTDVNHLLSKLEESECPLKIVVLDACRNDPFTRSWHRSTESSGLSYVNATMGTVISYATAPGRTANDGTGRNSPFTKAFLKTLDTPGLTILNFFNEVGTTVQADTKNKQTPWMTSSAINGNFCFNTQNVNTSSTPPYPAPTQALERQRSETEALETVSSPPAGYDQERNYLDESELERMARELEEKRVEREHLYELGKEFMDRDEYENALPYLLKAGNMGHVNAQKELAFMYFHGYGTEQNYEETVKWLNEAASANDNVAQHDLGYMYEYGFGFSKPDINGAIYWYHESAKNGNKKAYEAWLRLYKEH
jgi:hypothetical protein